jgi:2-polyprenyl-6-methoxyphenol hydroxylase-like FAD-dependent oxidoreductase
MNIDERTIVTDSSVQGSQRAVVLGASMAGLMAARVLADHFGEVTIVERDDLPTGPEDRRGAPQGRHLHVLLPRGSEVLEQLFPGILADLIASGSPISTGEGSDAPYMSLVGHRVAQPQRRRRPFHMYTPSRRLLEFHVRTRVKDLANVTFLEGQNVAGFLTGSDPQRVTGVRVARRASSTETILAAALFVDAMGRGSRTPVFLEELGYRRPIENELTVQLAYASQIVCMPVGTPKNPVLIMPEPGRPTGLTCTGNEGDTWTVTAGSMLGADIPRNRSELMDFVDAVAPPDLAGALRAAESRSEVTNYRVPSSRWRRYDRLRQFPQGLLVLGDAFCSFNPIYGQGMTVAALEALALRDCFTQGDRDLARRFFAAAAKSVSQAWRMAVGSDLALPEVLGRRTIATRITNAYFDWVMTAAETDAVVSEEFQRVIGMLDPPSSLARPSVTLRVMRTMATRLWL